MEDFEVRRVGLDEERTIVDLVAEEVPATIFVGAEELATLLASPSYLDELAVGFLYSSGLIEEWSAADRVQVDARHWTVRVVGDGQRIAPDRIFKRVFTSGCGRGTLFYRAADLAHSGKNRGDVRLSRAEIFKLMKEFQSASPEFQETGAVHSAALATASSILVLREDIGRHNAVDKVLGHALINRIDLEDKIVLSSGRLSSEIVLKVQKTAISTLVSRSAPTNQAIKHARGCDLTLVGFARANRMNVYSGERRIV